MINLKKSLLCVKYSKNPHIFNTHNQSYIIQKYFSCKNGVLLNEKKTKIILGISKRIEKNDKYKTLLIDISEMNLNQEILFKKTYKFILLDFNNNFKMDILTRQSFFHKTNNKYLYINKNKNFAEKKEYKTLLIKKDLYSENFEKEKIKQICNLIKY